MRKSHWISLAIALGIAALLSLFAFGQMANWSALLNTSGSRADATFGNASYLAAYMLFHLALASWLFFKRQHPALKSYYGGLFIVFCFVIVATETRGAILALGAAVVFAAMLTAWFHRSQAKVRRISLAVLLLVVFAGSLLYFSRDKDWVQNSSKIRRIINVSTEEVIPNDTQVPRLP